MTESYETDDEYMMNHINGDRFKSVTICENVSS